WLWTGGMFGVIGMTTTVLLLPVLGALYSTALNLTAQVMTTMIIDHFGLFGVAVYPASGWRISGGAIVVAAALLAVIAGRANPQLHRPPPSPGWYVAGLAIGMCFGFQVAINGQLTRGLGSALHSAFISFLVGTMFLDWKSGVLGRGVQTCALPIWRHRSCRGLVGRHRRTSEPAVAPAATVARLVCGRPGHWHVLWFSSGHQRTTHPSAGVSIAQRFYFVFGRHHDSGAIGGRDSLWAAHQHPGRTAQESVVDVDRRCVGCAICHRGCVFIADDWCGRDGHRHSGGADCRVPGGRSFWAVVGTQKTSPTTASSRTGFHDLWGAGHKRPRSVRLDIERFVEQFLDLHGGQ